MLLPWNDGIVVLLWGPGVQGGQVGLYPVEFAGWFDQAGDRRAPEVGEHGGIAVALARRADQTTPAVGRFVKAALGQAEVTAASCDQALQTRQAWDEGVGHVAGPRRFQ